MKKISLMLLGTLVAFSTTRAQDRIYWGDQNADKIGSVNASDLGSELTPASGGVSFNPSGIAYYQANPTYPLFYASSASIYRDDVAGSSNAIITPTGQFNRGVVIDFGGQKIYWANQQNGYIGRADLDGSNKDEAYITGLNNPWDIDIDPVNQKIYWSEDADDGKIQRASLSDGSNIEAVVHNVKSLGVAVDPLRNKIYYTVFGTGANIYSVNLDGSGGTGPISTLTAIADIDVDVATGTLYMVDYGSNGLTKADPDGNNKTTIAASGTFIAYGDVTTPVISTITRQGVTADVGEGGTATFRVTFSEPVLNVDAADFEVATPGGTITVNPVSLHKEFDVVVSNITGTGTLQLQAGASQDIFDFRGNAFEGTISSAETFNVITAPTPAITSFDPGFGPEGTTVTVTGADFSATPEENTVAFNNVVATVTSSSATTITVTVPAGASTGPVSVTVLGLTGTSAGDFTVCALPPVPTIGRDGNVLTSSAAAGNQWLKDDADISGATGTTFTPTSPGDYAVRVTVNQCSSLSTAVTVTEAELTPDITGFSPPSGQRGTAVIITGTDFSATPADNIVTINGVEAPVTASTPNSITTTVPTTAPLGAGAITVTVYGRIATSATDFTVICAPPAKPTITTDGGLLTSSSNTGNQWLKNGADIPGATGNTYTATTPGAYSVKVTIDGCSAESDPTTIVGTDETFASAAFIYPNPATSTVRVELPSLVSPTTVDIFTVTGTRKESILLGATGGMPAAEFNVASYPEGMYIVMITSREGRMTRKLVKR